MVRLSHETSQTEQPNVTVNIRRTHLWRQNVDYGEGTSLVGRCCVGVRGMLTRRQERGGEVATHRRS